MASHSFDIALAAELGSVELAIMYNHIEFWCTINAKAKRNIYDDCVWTYNSAEAIADNFPYWSGKKVRRLLDALVKKGKIKKGNYNKTKFDRTCWYGIPQGEIHFPDLGNGKPESGKPIPDTDTDTLPNKDSPPRPPTGASCSDSDFSGSPKKNFEQTAPEPSSDSLGLSCNALPSDVDGVHEFIPMHKQRDMHPGVLLDPSMPSKPAGNATFRPFVARFSPAWGSFEVNSPELYNVLGHYLHACLVQDAKSRDIGADLIRKYLDADRETALDAYGYCVIRDRLDTVQNFGGLLRQALRKKASFDWKKHAAAVLTDDIEIEWGKL